MQTAFTPHLVNVSQGYGDWLLPRRTQALPKASQLDTSTAKKRNPADPRVAGLVAFNRDLKQNSRDALLAGATKLFCRDGYSAVSVEKITTEAGVSRVTYYRHFSTKAGMALELFQRAAGDAVPHVLAIGSRDFRDRGTVAQWLTEYFALNRSMQGILRVLIEASVAERDFSEEVRPFIFDLITALGMTIPAFAIDGQAPEDERRRVQAWLLIYTILDQGNHAATRAGIAASPMMIEVLTGSFLNFVGED